MKTELLLPVGNMEMCMAAVHHGADAIYVGVPFFNARGRTTDLSFDELKEMIEFCHLYGVKVNLAFNVVIFQNEIPRVIDLLSQILPLAPDAIIVQDLGLAKIIRALAPHQRLHASTQMTVTNADAIAFLSDLKIDRFVLGRENSLNEIKLIREKTDKELEVFVHGALCVAYSGQCFTSESLGGRSANRGQCAQSCRLPYELIVDGEKRDLGNLSYLVSPKDLMGIAELPELKALGVNSFKVEGRLKTPEYVASAARNYRDVLDGEPVDLNRRRVELSSTYSRGFFSGWLHGVNHQELVDGTFSSHRGLEVGRVVDVKKNRLLISSEVELKAGMGLLFVDHLEKGSKIFTVSKIGKHFEIELVQKNLTPEKGAKVYLNSNEVLSKELQRKWQSRENQKKIPLTFEVEGAIGTPLKVCAFDPEGRKVEVLSTSVFVESSGRPVDDKFIKEELSSLGSTIYYPSSFHFSLGRNLFLHQREIKEVRRKVVEKMNTERIRRVVPDILPFELRGADASQAVSRGLNLLLRNISQVEGFVAEFQRFEKYRSLTKTVILDFEFGKDYQRSLELIKALGLRVGIATTRILKPSEYYNLNTIIRLNPDVILVRNLGAIQYIKDKCSIPLMGDFSLNVTNSLSLEFLLSKGLESVNASYDLNQDQLLSMMEFVDPSQLEVTVHQYMPEFHMEHCVFAAFLSKGTSFKDCGKPCERHEVKLKDPYGQTHFLKADHECRNTFFKATPQSAAFLMDILLKKGVSTFRIEALNETSTDLNHKIETYLKLLSGDIGHEEALDHLKIVETYGLSPGQMSKSDNYRDRKK
jgi:putative protease